MFTSFFKSAGKKVALSALAVMVSAVASATPKWYAYYVDVQPYPAGAGVVYATPEENVDEAAITGWGEDIELQEVVQINSIYLPHKYYCYGKSDQGYIVAGLAKGVDPNEDGTWIPQTDENGGIVICNTSSPLYLEATTPTEYDDETSATNAAPLFPTECAFVVFTHVAVKGVNGEASLGKVNIDKVVNELGDVVSISATPADERCSFAYWTKKSTGEKYTDNPMSIQVTEADEYIGHFACDSAAYFNIPEGGYIVWYNENRYTLPEGAISWSFLDNSESTQYFFDQSSAEGRMTYFSPYEQTMGAYAHNANIIYIKGEATLVSDGNDGAWYPTNNVGVYTDKEVNIADLPTSCTYYNTDLENHCFTKVPASQATFPANSMYLSMPNDIFAAEFPEVPEYIYWSESYAQPQAADGITSVEVTATDGKIYNINGMEMKKAGKGIYILNGKKVLNK